jgi:glycosyltransferase involved in cell wall biosynthesis
MKRKNQIKAVVAQKGAREHYLLARSLYRENMLAALVVDWYPKLLSKNSFSHFTKYSNILLKAANAYCQDLPNDQVIGTNLHGFFYRIRSSIAQGEDKYRIHLKNDKHFACLISSLDLPEHDVMICYSYAGLEALDHAKRRGKLAVLDQIDPGPLERQMVAEEEKKWPHYVHQPLTIHPDYEDRVKKEWEIADLIIVNSEWSEHQLRQQGVPGSKIAILPLAYDPPSRPISHDPIPKVWSKERKLRILWLGQVIVRKGIQYLIQAANDLEDEPIEFLIAGPIGIPQAIVSQSPANINWLSNVPRSQVPECYQKADVFILPTLSDGFAITQIEALNYGLPTIVTRNCARVVENGKTGFVVSAYDSDAIVRAVRRFLENPDLIPFMRQHCLRILPRYSLEAHSRMFSSILTTHLNINSRLAFVE